jgi:hypothetical protein
MRMRRTDSLVSRLTVGVALAASTFVLPACTSEDVGGKGTRDSASSVGGSSQAAGGAAGIDTAGANVSTERSGSAVAPGPGRVPGTPGALTGDSAGGGTSGSGAKTKARRP